MILKKKCNNYINVKIKRPNKKKVINNKRLNNLC